MLTVNKRLNLFLKYDPLFYLNYTTAEIKYLRFEQQRRQRGIF